MIPFRSSDFAFSPQRRLSLSRLWIAVFLILTIAGSALAQKKPRFVATPLDLPRSGAEFPPELLANVSDLTSGFPADEREAYYMLLSHSQTTDQLLQKKAAAENLARADADFHQDPKNVRKKHQLFYDLVTRPSSWRGQPVTLTGYIRDLTPMEAGDNSFGLENLYQAHLFTEDSTQFPYVVICTKIPESLPTPSAKHPTDYVTVTGYFFKLWTYRAGTESGHWSAPLILADHMEWNPPAKKRSAFKDWYSTALFVAGGFMLVMLYLRWRDNTTRRALRHVISSAGPGRFELPPETSSSSDNDSSPAFDSGSATNVTPPSTPRGTDETV